MGILDNIKKTLGGKRSGVGASDSAAPSADPGTALEAQTGEQLNAASTYTVQSGDTLWKIASRTYGDVSLYPKIFEANKGLLKSPDHIFPGQELVIPPAADPG